MPGAPYFRIGYLVHAGLRTVHLRRSLSTLEVLTTVRISSNLRLLGEAFDFVLAAAMSASDTWMKLAFVRLLAPDLHYQGFS